MKAHGCTIELEKSGNVWCAEVWEDRPVGGLPIAGAEIVGTPDYEQTFLIAKAFAAVLDVQLGLSVRSRGAA